MSDWYFHSHRGRKMPLCIDRYTIAEEYLADKDVMIRQRICQIYYADEEKIPCGEPFLQKLTVSTRERNHLKTAYVNVGSEKRRISVQQIDLPDPFYWAQAWPSLETFVGCSEEEFRGRIRAEFSIDISSYLTL